MRIVESFEGSCRRRSRLAPAPAGIDTSSAASQALQHRLPAVSAAAFMPAMAALARQHRNEPDLPPSQTACGCTHRPFFRCGRGRASLRSPAEVSGQAGIRSRLSGRAEILIALYQLRVVPCPPRVPSPAAFGRRRGWCVPSGSASARPSESLHDCGHGLNIKAQPLYPKQRTAETKFGEVGGTNQLACRTMLDLDPEWPRPLLFPNSRSA